MDRDPTTGALVIAPNDDRYLSVRGDIVEVTEEDAVEHYNELDRRYTGAENRYESRTAVTVRFGSFSGSAPTSAVVAQDRNRSKE